jgi:Uma2 family endonuclease
MAVDVQTRRFTVREFNRMGKLGLFRPGERLELIEGEIIQMNPIGSRHASVVNRLNALFSRAVGEAAQVSIQNPVILDDFSEPQPDLLVLRPREDDYESALPTGADVLLLAEVSDSTLRHDRRKTVLYARSGIQEVWLVVLDDQPERDTIQVHTQPGPDDYAQVRTLRRGETFAAAAFPDVPIAVSAILKGPFGP